MKNRQAKLSLFILLISYCMSMAAQPSKIYENISFGKISATGQDIKAKVYDFNGEYPNIKIDNLNNKLFVSTRKTHKDGKSLTTDGHIYILNLQNGQEYWNRKTNFYRTNVHYTPNGVLITKGNTKNTLLNLETGEKIWNKPFALQAIYDDHLLAYKSDLYQTSDQLQYRDIHTGEILWETTLQSKYSWASQKKLNDSTLLISAGGLHLINTTDGTGWHFATETGSDYYTNLLAANIVHVLPTIVSGVGLFETGYDVVSGLVSNILTEKNAIYQANRQSLFKLNHSGELIWITELPPKMASSSILYFYDNKIIQINPGEGFLNNKKVRIGQPFIACYEKETGKRLFLNLICGEKEKPEDFMFCKDGFNILFTNKIARIKNERYDQTNYTAWDTQTNGELSALVREQVYTTLNSKIIKSDVPAEYHVYNKESELFTIHPESGAVTKLNADSTYLRKDQWKGLNFVTSSGKNILVVDNEGNQLADFPLKKILGISNDKLYALYDTNLVEIDLNQFTLQQD